MLRSGTKLLRCAGSCIGASVCVPKTLSVLIGGGNHLTSAHNDRAAMFCPERPTRHRVLACIFCLGRMARLCTEMGSEIIPRAADPSMRGRGARAWRGEYPGACRLAFGV